MRVRRESVSKKEHVEPMTAEDHARMNGLMSSMSDHRTPFPRERVQEVWLLEHRMRAEREASDRLARATWALAGATIGLVLATIGLIVATVT